MSSPFLLTTGIPSQFEGGRLCRYKWPVLAVTALPADIESRVVIAGLDPAIHLFRKKMDARVKPAHDAERICSIRAEFAVVSIAQEQTFALHVGVAAGARTGKLACH